METCPVCLAEKKPKQRCLVCRRNEYYFKQGIIVEDPCKTCGVKTKLAKNGDCEPCLALQGLKECTCCREIKSSFLSFDTKKGVCKQCLHPLASLTATERARHRSLMKQYGISYDQFVSLASSQGGLCKVCETHPDKLVVDHDHKTGKIRGLLCGRCNVMLGMGKDTPQILQKGAAYLEAAGVSSVQARDLPLHPARDEFDRRLLLARIQDGVNQIASLEAANSQLRAEIANVHKPDVTRALAVALKRKLEADRPTKARDQGLKWLQGLLLE